MDKKQTIERLTELVNDINEYERLDNEFFSETKWRDYKLAIEKIRDEVGTLGNVPRVFSNLPIFKKPKETQKKSDDFKKSATKGIGCLAGCLLLMLLVDDRFLGGLLVIIEGIMLIAGIMLCVKAYGIYKPLREAQKSNFELKKSEAKAMDAFERAVLTLESEKTFGMEAAHKYKDEVAEAMVKIRVEDEKYLDEGSAILEKRYEIKDRMEANEFWSDKYLHLMSDVLMLLESGRADDYKEALNLAIAEEREEKENQRRTAILQQQAEEQYRHNKQMEQEQAEARKIQEATVTLQEKMRKEQRNSQMSVCFKCKHYNMLGSFSGGCAGGIVGCGSFTPK